MLLIRLQIMKKILILQFRTNEKTLAEERAAFEKSYTDMPVELVFKNAFLDTLDWKNAEKILENFDGLILGGSGEYDFDGGRNKDDEKQIASHTLVDSMSLFLQYVNEKNFPTLMKK